MGIATLKAKIAEYEIKIVALDVFLNEMSSIESEYAPTLSNKEILTEILEGFIEGGKKVDASFGTLKDEYEIKVKARKVIKNLIYSKMDTSHTELMDKYSEAQILIIQFRAEIIKLEEMIAQIEAMGG